MSDHQCPTCGGATDADGKALATPTEKTCPKTLGPDHRCVLDKGHSSLCDYRKVKR